MNLTAEQLRNVDIRTVDPDTLIDLNDVVINPELTQEERMIEFVRQIKNPYCYKIGKGIIKVGHIDTTASLEDRLFAYFLSL